MKLIPYGRHNLTKSDILEVNKVLKSDFLTQGPKVPEFEKYVNKLCNSKFSVATNSATSALHLACLALDLKKGDILWASPITFVASVNCGLYCQASIDFVDIDINTYNMCHIELAKKLETAKINKILPKIVVVTHLSGQSANMFEMKKLSKKFKFKIIEDASHAIGAKYRDSYVGNCKFSDITIFSFHPVKIITTAEGGMALTNNKKIFEKLFNLRSHGITKDKLLFKSKIDGPWFYEQINLGFNYRMNDIQAALGTSQLKRIKKSVNKRNSIANYYFKRLKDLPLILPFIDEQNYSSFHLFIIRIDNNQLKKSHKKIFQELIKNGLGVGLHYIPIFKQHYFKKFKFQEKNFLNAMKYYKSAISIPIYENIKKVEQDRVIDILKKVLR